MEAEWRPLHDGPCHLLPSPRARLNPLAVVPRSLAVKDLKQRERNHLHGSSKKSSVSQIPSSFDTMRKALKWC